MEKREIIGIFTVSDFHSLELWACRGFDSLRPVQLLFNEIASSEQRL